MNIANQLTVGRICLIPVFMAFMYLQPDFGAVELLGATIPLWQLIAGLIFIVASFTDYLDGYLARKYQLVTQFGVFADPMADKLLVIAAFLALVQHQRIPAWIVTVIICRELLVTGLRVLLAKSDGEVLAAAWPGKVKTTTQMLAIICYLFNDCFFIQWNLAMSRYLLYICLFFTVYSGVEYFYHARFIFQDESL